MQAKAVGMQHARLKQRFRHPRADSIKLFAVEKADLSRAQHPARLYVQDLAPIPDNRHFAGKPVHHHIDRGDLHPRFGQRIIRQTRPYMLATSTIFPQPHLIFAGGNPHPMIRRGEATARCVGACGAGTAFSACKSAATSPTANSTAGSNRHASPLVVGRTAGTIGLPDHGAGDPVDFSGSFSDKFTGDKFAGA